MDDTGCIHDIDPSTCTICLGRSSSAAMRAKSMVSKHRYLSCELGGRERPESKFPTNTAGVRLEDRCRECRDYLAAEKKSGTPADEAVSKRRRQFPSPPR